MALIDAGALMMNDKRYIHVLEQHASGLSLHAENWKYNKLMMTDDDALI
jgi:hypothetical protein